MPNKLSKVISIFLYVLLGVSVILGIFYYTGGNTEASATAVYPEPVYTEVFLIWAYILAGLATLFAVGFPLIRAIMNPKSAKKGVLPLLLGLVIIFIAYQFASDDVIKMVKETESDPFVLKYAGTVLITTYLLAGIAIVSILYSEIEGIFK
jgi:hypothetical protein